MAAFARRCVRCRNTLVLKQGNRPICLTCRRKPKPSIKIVVPKGTSVNIVQG